MTLKIRRKVHVVETVEVANDYKVPKSQWKKWNEQARYVFNYVFGMMIQNHGLFLHPKQVKVEHEQWNTTCWNAAWTAADATNESGE